LKNTEKKEITTAKFFNSLHVLSLTSLLGHTSRHFFLKLMLFLIAVSIMSRKVNLGYKIFVGFALSTMLDDFFWDRISKKSNGALYYTGLRRTICNKQVFISAIGAFSTYCISEDKFFLKIIASCCCLGRKRESLDTCSLLI
jgi:hypothetical protein